MTVCVKCVSVALGATERKLFSKLHPVALKYFNAFALTVKTATHFFKKLFLLHISSRFSPRGTEENCFCPFGTISVWVSYAILGCGEFTAKRFVRHLCVQNLCLQPQIKNLWDFYTSSRGCYNSIDRLKNLRYDDINRCFRWGTEHTGTCNRLPSVAGLFFYIR